jgi:pimeloyl-ACP methyl ester carboxylesterase
MKKILFNLLIIIGLLSCQKEQITISADAHDVFFLQNEGSAMPIRVHGNTASKVFILMVHGGPGSDGLIYRQEYVIQNVENQCAMIYWNQRNSGNSQGSINDGYDNVEQFVKDFEKVVVLLKKRYGADISLFVNGHSWGGFLTPAFLQKGNNQAAVKGWIQTAGAHNIPLLNQYSRQMQLDQANIEIAANRNVVDWTEIRDYCNSLTLPLTTDQALKLNVYSSLAILRTPELSGTGYTFGVLINQYMKNNADILQLYGSAANPLIQSLGRQIFSGKQVSDSMSVITIPTLLLFGKYDYTCPPQLADDIFSRIKSTYKKKVVFEKSGHVVMQSLNEKEYWAEVLAFVNKFK